MQADPLQQLRALHTPEPPGLWPPAPGWWVLAALLALLMAQVVRLGIDLRRELAPHRQARREHGELKTQLAAGQIDDASYLHLGNALLKRLLLFALDDRGVAASSGQDWLLALDRLTDSTGFSHGPGKVLANARFAATAPAIPPELPDLIDRALEAARSRALRRWADRWVPGRRRREADA
ncbi:MAG: DUF4381 domain-containing protein [Pseudomonadota bacterium]